MDRNAVRKGFTLIELMAVVIILAVLAGVALPKFFDYQDQAKLSSIKGTLGGVRAGIANFYANEALTSSSARYPTMTELTDGSTMQEQLPDNPYNNNSGVETADAAAATARTFGGADGWRYYVDNGLTPPAQTFFAHSDTSGVSENDL